MSVETKVEAGLSDVLHFLVKAESSFAKAAPAVQSAALTTLQVVITAVNAADQAALQNGLSIQLDGAVATDVKAVITQFAADLKMVGIKL